MKKYKTVRVSNDFYDFLNQEVKKKETSFRIESKVLLNDYTKLKTMEKQLKGKKLFMIK